MTCERLTLRAGPLMLDVLPAVGGSIARFDYLGPEGRQPLLRGTDSPYSDVLEAACFPLVPYANRIRGGVFQCDGREIRLAGNLAGDASPLHGQGWRAAWLAENVASDRLDMVYRHAAGEWPWDYEARQQLVLSAEGLSMKLSCQNLSATPMPCGLGLHPYYPCTPGTLLDTSVASVWTVDADVLPVEQLPAAGRYSLHHRPICGQDLDNGFGGWGGTARITWPESGRGLQLDAADASYFQVYSPVGRGFFAAEPVQHANAALNAPQDQWRQQGIMMLAQGETRRLQARFSLV
ncbi:MAG: aldose 1-epimerase [Polaromonas sp.]|jgi:aldose 1-epimerase|nr:aldose 1-epimerase [Polaromonas sp.]